MAPRGRRFRSCAVGTEAGGQSGPKAAETKIQAAAAVEAREDEDRLWRGPRQAGSAHLSCHPSAMSSPSSPGDCIILLDEDGSPSPAPAVESEKDPGPSGPLPGSPAQKGLALGKDPSSLRTENERLFAEFVTFCTQHTEDHPEVISYLTGRHQKTSPEYLASVEFRNVLGRCLTRVQARKSKVYVYINELCTTFRAHAQKRKVPCATEEAQAVPLATPCTEVGPPEPAKPPVSSKRHIRYLENLLRVYTQEIKRLQEQELDLAELDSADSAYMQESRLKRRLMRVFKMLCQLKGCPSLTGRVIEKRIPYRGTRYPEVNRRIERLINQPEAFPDFADILKVVQKASKRHSLGLPKRQMEGMAADAFRDVGCRLQERRRLDLIYNFGSHLTDQYRPSADPALLDGELARHLQRNQELGVHRLEQVISQFAQLQDKDEAAGEERRLGLGGEQECPSLGRTPVATREGHPGEEEEAGGRKTSQVEEEDHEEEEEEEEDSSESDLEAELAKCLNGEEEEILPEPDEDPPEQALIVDSSPEEEDVEEDMGLMEGRGPGCSPSPLLMVGTLTSCPLPSPCQPLKHSCSLENGVSHGQPPHKRSRPGEGLVSRRNNCTEVVSAGSQEQEAALSPRPSARAASPDLGLVSSSQDSPLPYPGQELHSKTSVATQCDPEEIIVLSDSE